MNSRYEIEYGGEEGKTLKAKSTVILNVSVFISAVDPLKEPLVNELVTPLPGPCWEFLVQKFGGGPEVNALDVCSLCKVE